MCAHASAALSAQRIDRARTIAPTHGARVAARAPFAYSPSMRTTGTVKWFDPEAGDGCVVSDGCTQAALDRATLAAAGILTIAPGTALTYEVELAEGRLTVTEIYEIDGISPSEAAKRRARTRGKIKWFDPVKGIVLTNDVQGDVLLHRSALQQWDGSTVVGEDGDVAHDVGEKLRGFRARLRALDKAGLITRRPREIVIEPSGPWVEATCKWFSRPKGYGLLVVGDDSEVFVHMDILRCSNIRELRAGQRVNIRVRRTEKGLLATAVALIP
jgi:CspA family cold shock protein